MEPGKLKCQVDSTLIACNSCNNTLIYFVDVRNIEMSCFLHDISTASSYFAENQVSFASQLEASGPIFFCISRQCQAHPATFGDRSGGGSLPLGSGAREGERVC